MKTFASTISLALCATNVLAAAPNLSGTEWKKTLFLDDFNGGSGSAPSSANWIVQTGTGYPGGPAQWGTFEVQSYTRSSTNVRQSGTGNLIITPVKSSTGKWTSARVETVSNSFAAPAGGKLRIDGRIKIPNVTGSNGLGYWPAFWAIGGDFRQNRTNWPAVGEIDIMENVNGGSSIYNVLHCDINPGGVCNEPSGLGAMFPCSGTACVGNFHTYSVRIDRTVKPEVMRFWLDGRQIRSITETQLGSALWARTIQKGFYVILNVAMGGSFPNAIAGFQTPTAATVSGRSMEVDYVGVWATK